MIHPGGFTFSDAEILQRRKRGDILRTGDTCQGLIIDEMRE